MFVCFDTSVRVRCRVHQHCDADRRRRNQVLLAPRRTIIMRTSILQAIPVVRWHWAVLVTLHMLNASCRSNMSMPDACNARSLRPSALLSGYPVESQSDSDLGVRLVSSDLRRHSCAMCMRRQYCERPSDKDASDKQQGDSESGRKTYESAYDKAKKQAQAASEGATRKGREAAERVAHATSQAQQQVSHAAKNSSEFLSALASEMMKQSPFKAGAQQAEKPAEPAGAVTDRQRSCNAGPPARCATFRATARSTESSCIDTSLWRLQGALMAQAAQVLQTRAAAAARDTQGGATGSTNRDAGAGRADSSTGGAGPASYASRLFQRARGAFASATASTSGSAGGASDASESKQSIVERLRSEVADAVLPMSKLPSVMLKRTDVEAVEIKVGEGPSDLRC